MDLKPNIKQVNGWLTPQDKPQPAALIFVFGSRSLKSPQKAAELYKDNLAPIILVTGKTGTFGNKDWTKPIAEVFELALLEQGIPETAILTQTDSMNTLEDVTLSKEIIAKYVKPGGKIIVVARPLHQLRALLTIKKQLPQYEYINQPAELDPQYDSETTINERCCMEIARIREYSKKDDILSVEIPDFVRDFSAA